MKVKMPNQNLPMKLKKKKWLNLGNCREGEKMPEPVDEGEKMQEPADEGEKMQEPVDEGENAKPEGGVAESSIAEKEKMPTIDETEKKNVNKLKIFL